MCNPNVSTVTNRFTTLGYTYDKNGNLKADAKGKRYSYDAENHPKEYFSETKTARTMPEPERYRRACIYVRLYLYRLHQKPFLTSDGYDTTDDCVSKKGCLVIIISTHSKSAHLFLLLRPKLRFYQRCFPILKKMSSCFGKFLRQRWEMQYMGWDRLLYKPVERT